MAGTYTIDFDMSLYSHWSYANPRQFGVDVTFNKKVTMRSLHGYFTNSNGVNSRLLMGSVWDVETGETLLMQNQWLGTGTNFWFEQILNSPLYLQAGKVYRVGWSIASGYDTYLPIGNYKSGTFSSTPAGINVTLGNSYYGSSTLPSIPTTSYSQPPMIKFGLDLNAMPNAPTNVAVTNSPVPSGTSVNVQWTHNDPDSDPQSKYQLRWRKL